MTLSVRLAGGHRRLLASLMVGLVGFASSTVEAASLKIGMVSPPGHIWNQVADRFNDNLEKASNGQYHIRMSSLAKLQGEPEMIAQLQSDNMELAILTVGSLAGFEPAFTGWYMPYRFADVIAVAKATRNEDARNMLASLNDHQMVGLGYALSGMRQVISVKPVQSVADFKDMKVRAFPAPVFQDWWKNLQATPVQLAISDVAPALTAGQLDAVDVDLDMAVGLQLYKQAPNLLFTNHMAFPGVMVASRKWWDGLSDADRKMVTKAFQEAESWGFQKQAEAEVANLAHLKAEGVNVVQPDLQGFRQVGDSIVKQYSTATPAIGHFITNVE